MAAPTVTARSTPTGYWLDNGFRTKITFALDVDVSLWEMTVTPAGLENGEPIPQDSMWNTTWRIKRARELLELTPSQMTFLFDPDMRQQIQSFCGQETTITETLPDGSQVAYYGYLRSVTFQPLTPGQPGQGTAVIQPTQWDKTNKVEAGPTFVNVSGT